MRWKANTKGCAAIIWKPQRRDERGMHRPLANCFYDRAKNRNGVQPLRLMETAELTVVCTCIGQHKPLRVLMAPGGEPDVIRGNEKCWYNQLEFCRKGQSNDCKDRIFRYCFQHSQQVWMLPANVFFSSNQLHVDTNKYSNKNIGSTHEANQVWRDGQRCFWSRAKMRGALNATGCMQHALLIYILVR